MMVPFTGLGKTGKVTGFEGKNQSFVLSILIHHIKLLSDFKYICQELRVEVRTIYSGVISI